MTFLAKNAERGELSCAQQEALVRLLDDDDPTISEAVEGRILDCGETALAWLTPHLLERNPAIRRKVIHLVELIGRRGADNRFLAACLRRGEEFDLEAAIWALARTRYPGINVGAYEALLDSYARDLADRLPTRGRAAPLLAVINRYLFEYLGYSGNQEDYYEPENSYLNRVIDRRLGNPVSLCMIYLFLARRLRIPVSGIGLPGHFVCRYQSPKEEVYIDAFNAGRILSKADCIRYLVQVSYGYQEGCFAPASPRRILLRVCSNLHQVYHHRRDREETQRLQRYVVALAR